MRFSRRRFGTIRSINEDLKKKKKASGRDGGADEIEKAEHDSTRIGSGRIFIQIVIFKRSGQIFWGRVESEFPSRIRRFSNRFSSQCLSGPATMLRFSGSR